MKVPASDVRVGDVLWGGRVVDRVVRFRSVVMLFADGAPVAVRGRNAVPATAQIALRRRSAR